MLFFNHQLLSYFYDLNNVFTNVLFNYYIISLHVDVILIYVEVIDQLDNFLIFIVFYLLMMIDLYLDLNLDLGLGLYYVSRIDRL
jgi:hypothetical protein